MEINSYEQNKEQKEQVPKITFRFNERREIDNWYATFNGTPKFGLRGGRTRWYLGDIPEDVSREIAGLDEESAKSIIKNRIEEELKNPEKIRIMEEAIGKAKERWQTVDKDYFSLLSKLINVPVEKFEKQYFAEYTLSARCPFRKDGFMFNRFKDFADIAMHEIMHIEFLKEYRGYCKERGLDDNQIDHLKEILTALLNEPMKNLLSQPDIGYTKHVELRERALEIYKNSKNFLEFLDKMIELVKGANF
jgi:hypothetical protein